MCKKCHFEWYGFLFFSLICTNYAEEDVLDFVFIIILDYDENMNEIEKEKRTILKLYTLFRLILSFVQMISDFI